MKLPKHLAGSNPAKLQALYNARMKKAYEMESTLEAKTFSYDSEALKLVITGKPFIQEIHIKSDITPTELLTAMNSLLHEAHLFRDAMAKELLC